MEMDDDKKDPIILKEGITSLRCAVPRQRTLLDLAAAGITVRHSISLVLAVFVLNLSEETRRC